MITGTKPRLRDVVAIGGGPIAKEELKYAEKFGIEITYRPARPKKPEKPGSLGAVDDWMKSRSLFSAVIEAANFKCESKLLHNKK